MKTAPELQKYVGESCQLTETLTSLIRTTCVGRTFIVEVVPEPALLGCAGNGKESEKLLCLKSSSRVSLPMEFAPSAKISI